MRTKLFLLLPLFAAVTGCFRPDSYSFVVSVPGMAGPECAQIIMDRLKQVDGVQQVLPDYENRTVTVTYQNIKVARKNIEYVIAGAGFQANQTGPSAKAKAQLPPPCR